MDERRGLRTATELNRPRAEIVRWVTLQRLVQELFNCGSASKLFRAPPSMARYWVLSGTNLDATNLQVLLDVQLGCGQLLQGAWHDGGQIDTIGFVSTESGVPREFMSE